MKTSADFVSLRRSQLLVEKYHSITLEINLLVLLFIITQI